VEGQPGEITAEKQEGVVGSETTGISSTEDTSSVQGKRISRIMITGDVPPESWTDIFRCFINPGLRMTLKRQKLGIDFDMLIQEGHSFDENDPTIKAMIESARQLGLEIKIE